MAHYPDGTLRSSQQSIMRQALDKLAREYGAPLARYFRRRVYNEADVSDLVQDVLTRLAMLPEQTRLRQPENYIFRTAANALRDKARRDRVRHVNSAVVFDPMLHGELDIAPDRILAGRQALDAVHQALQSLPNRTRDVFNLRAFEGYKTTDTAKMLGISSRSVETHYARALLVVANVIRRHGHE